MTVDEIYTFEKSTTNKAKYLLVTASKKNGCIPLPIEKKSGRAYIEFMPNVTAKKYPYGFYLGYIGNKHKRLTGVVLDIENDNADYVCCGDAMSLNKPHLLIFQFSKQMQCLTMYVIYGAYADRALYLSKFLSKESIYCESVAQVI